MISYSKKTHSCYPIDNLLSYIYLYIPSKYLCIRWHDCSGSIFSNVKKKRSKKKKKRRFCLLPCLTKSMTSSEGLKLLMCQQYYLTPREQRCFPHFFSTNQSGKSCQINHCINCIRWKTETHILHSRPATSLDSKRLGLMLPPNYLSISNQTGKGLTTSSGKWLPEI